MSWFKRNKIPKHLADDLSVGQQFFIFAWELFKIVVISLVIILPIRYYVIKPFYVKGASMEPNFHDFEYLVIDEISYRFNEPIRGDVVIFRYPSDPSQFFIKRVVGMPGETIKIADGDVIIFNQQDPDGVVLEETYLPVGLQTNGSVSVELKSDQYFVLGDNRNASLDSRVFGPLNKNFIIGKALLRGWPINRAGLLPNDIEYNL